MKGSNYAKLTMTEKKLLVNYLYNLVANPKILNVATLAFIPDATISKVLCWGCPQCLGIRMKLGLTKQDK